MQTDLDETSIGIPPFHTPDVKQILQNEIIACQLRGLSHGAAWLSDLSLSIKDAPINISTVSLTNEYSLISSCFDVYSLAKSYFDREEYQCCFHCLEKHGDNNMLFFLRTFAKFKAIKKSIAECSLNIYQNNELPFKEKFVLLKDELEKRNANPATLLDSYSLYLLSLIYQNLGMKEEVKTTYLKALHKNPNFWPAWYELSQVLVEESQLNNLDLPDSFMKHFFEIKACLVLRENERALRVIHDLSKIGFASSHNLCLDAAIAYQNLRQMQRASQQFSIIHSLNRYSLDGMDLYSNVLFVLEDRPTLSYLASHFYSLFKFKAESCVIVGNFYSLRSQHDKALIYFQRALKLKPSYCFVWTLMGHEYLELGNAHAAIHHYRKAIDYNPSEYRAYYGLGQCYEILKQYFNSLHYYAEAVVLKPDDSQMCIALGEIYLRLTRLSEAKKCFWRAYSVGDQEGTALLRLAKCFEADGEKDETAAAYIEFIKLCDRHGSHKVEDLCAAHMHLARYHFERQDYTNASISAYKCLDFSTAMGVGKAILSSISAKQSQPNQEGGDNTFAGAQAKEESGDRPMGIRQSFPSLIDPTLDSVANLSAISEASEDRDIDMGLDDTT